MRRRLLTSYLALTVVVLAALIVPLGVTYAQREREHLESALMRDAFVLSAYVEDSLEGGNSTGLTDVAASYEERTGARIVIVDKDAVVLADSDPSVEDARSFASRPEVAEALASRVSIGTRASETLGTTLLYVAVPVTSGGEVHGAVRLTYSTAQVDARVHRYWSLLAVIAIVSLSVATAVGILLSRWVARPVQRLRDAATSLGAGNLESRAFAASGPPEIRELATAFNLTASRLQLLLASQEQFVADASHQLRSPLTAVRLRLEMIEADLDEPAPDLERVGTDVAAAGGEVSRLSRLVDGLLALATAERRGTSNTAKPVSLAALIEDRVEAWQPVAGERGITLVSVSRRLTAHATIDRVSQVLDNLIANAIDASQPGDVIRIEASTPLGAERSPLVELHVVDQGSGMTAEQRAHAFDRFWRADHAPGRLGGSGLGLAIVQKLVESDNGSVELQVSPAGGVDAVVRLPASTARLPVA